MAIRLAFIRAEALVPRQKTCAMAASLRRRPFKARSRSFDDSWLGGNPSNIDCGIEYARVGRIAGVSLHVDGSPDSAECPCPPGPRNCGQGSAAAADAARVRPTSKAVIRMVDDSVGRPGPAPRAGAPAGRNTI